MPVSSAANKDNITQWAGLGQSKDPLRDPLFYLGNHLVYTLLVEHSPVLELIREGNPVWRSYRV